MSKLNVLRALAADCREQGEADIASEIDTCVEAVEELCRNIRAEREAADSGDSIEHLHARLATTMTLMFIDPPAKKASDHPAPAGGDAGGSR